MNLAALETVAATLVAEATRISDHLRRVREYGEPCDPTLTRVLMAGMQRNLNDLNDLLEQVTRERAREGEEPEDDSRFFGTHLREAWRAAKPL